MSSETITAETTTAETTITTVETTPTPSVKKYYDLRSSDGEEFHIEENVAIQSVTIKNIIEDGCGDAVIPIPNVTAAILAKVIEYCKRHVAGADDDDDKKKELEAVDKEFIKVEQDVLFDLILAANYLNIKGLLDFTCQTVADMMKGKTPEEIRTLFHIVNDYTPDEEAEVRKENAWAFE